MMNKNAILKTAVCYWSNQDDCYIVESPLFDRTGGVGKTEEEAYQLFCELIHESYVSYLEGRLLGFKKPDKRKRKKIGRPAKGGVDLHTQVRPTSKQAIEKLAQDLGLSLGEVVDYVLFFYEKTVDPLNSIKNKRLDRRLKAATAASL